jgi:hypothetical protein
MEKTMAGVNITVPNGSYLCQVGPTENYIAIYQKQGIYSPARAIRLFGQDDGNFVLQYVDTSSLPGSWPTVPLDPSSVTWVTYWATNTAWNEIGDAGPVGNNVLVLQSDGNLVVYDLNKAQGFVSGRTSL